MPPGWITLELDASGPTWISLLECEGDVVDSERLQADAYLAGGRYLVLATHRTTVSTSLS